MKTKPVINSPMFNRIVSAVALLALGASCTTVQAADRLPSWNDAKAKARN